MNNHSKDIKLLEQLALDNEQRHLNLLKTFGIRISDTDLLTIKVNLLSEFALGGQESIERVSFEKKFQNVIKSNLDRIEAEAIAKRNRDALSVKPSDMEQIIRNGKLKGNGNGE